MNKDQLVIDMPLIVETGVQSRHRYPGKVVRIARKYVTVEVDRGGHTHEIEFDITTQKERGNNSFYAAVFRTITEQAILDREKQARQDLRDLGIDAKYSGPTNKRVLSLQEMEAIVQLIRRMRGEA